MLTPKQLLRLYPGLWRLRCGAEFLAMLESTPPSWRRTREVARAAAWEWLRWTRTGRLIIGLVVGTLAAACSLAISAAVPDWDVTASLRPLQGWSEFWAVLFVSSAPWLAATGVVVLARPVEKGSSRLGFGGQIAVLFACMLYGGLLNDLSRPVLWEGLMRFAKAAVSGGAFVAYFLVLAFNIERGAVWRRRLLAERVDQS